MDLQLQLEFSEEWRQVAGFEGCYEVSNFGRVRSLSRIDKIGRLVSGGLLRLRVYDRYLVVSLSLGRSHEGKAYRGGKPYLVHRLVAAAFIGPQPPGLTVDHRDGNKLNNFVGNLEYITQQEQIKRSIKLGSFHYMVGGEKNPQAKLSDADVIEIRRLYLEGMSQPALAKQFGISQQQVSKIVNRKRRRFTSEGQEL